MQELTEKELYDKAHKLYMDNKDEEAIPFYLRAIKMNQNEAAYHFELAQACKYTKKKENYPSADTHYSI